MERFESVKSLALTEVSFLDTYLVCYTYSIAEAQREFPRLSKSDRIVPVETMLELLETKDVMAEADAMTAIRMHQAKRSKFLGLDAISG
jgi:polysaccharide pyruvyl transferase WcaK-like protein